MSAPLNTFVVEEIRAGLARRRVTQDQLAAAIGISQATMSRRLAGTQPFTVPELERVAAFLDVPLGSLVGAA